MNTKEAIQYVRGLPQEAREELEDLLRESPKAALWSPLPGPQAEAYYSKADEVFYGGAAGGGKSSLIIGLALTSHQRSLILRRESTQNRGLLDDMARILQTRDGLNRQAGQWRIPGDKAVFSDQLIELGGVPNPGDEENHQGIPHDLLAFDEVTQFPEYIIDYLSSWNRSVLPDQRCRMLLTSNPPTPSTQYGSRGNSSGGGLWIIRRYAPWLDPQYRDPHGLGPAAPGELRWFVTLDGKETEWPDPLPFLHPRPDGSEEVIKPKSRTFIPARVTDNPYLASTDYEATLQKLPEPLRSAMLYGDFSISLTDRPAQLFPTEWLRAAQARWTAQSSASPSPTSFPQTTLGVDVARSGADSTVIQPRYGSFYDSPILIPTTQASDGPSVAAEVLKARRDQSTMVIDANGIGASVYDHLVQNTNLQDDLVAYVGSTQAPLRDRSGTYGFSNLRSQSYWMLREALDPATSDKIALPPDDDLLQELLAHTFEEQNGRLKILPKKEVTKQLGRSPDKADALIMAHTQDDPDAPQVRERYDAREARLEDAREQKDPYAWTPSTHGREPRWSDDRLPLPPRY